MSIQPVAENNRGVFSKGYEFSRLADDLDDFTPKRITARTIRHDDDAGSKILIKFTITLKAGGI